MELGKPVSQPFGEFQGRSEAFSDSVVAHPLAPSASAASKRQSVHRECEIKNLMKRKDKRE
jgi:hypothetical protein